MTVLQGPDREYPLKISLKLVGALEDAHGSLYLLAERLLDKTLPLSAMVGVLKILYRHVGCETAEEDLDDFLLRQPCTEILTSVLLDILCPIDRLGAISPGEPPPAQKTGSA